MELSGKIQLALFWILFNFSSLIQHRALVVIELKRDNSGSDVEWQAIKYASYCSSFSHDEIYKYFAKYLGANDDDAQVTIESFINCELECLNQRQRIILVAKDFHSEVISAVLWLRESEIDIECIRLTPYFDQKGGLFINPEIIRASCTGTVFLSS